MLFVRFILHVLSPVPIFLAPHVFNGSLADQLGHGYLRYWAKELGVADLAERLLSEVEACRRGHAVQ